MPYTKKIEGIHFNLSMMVIDIMNIMLENKDNVGAIQYIENDWMFRIDGTRIIADCNKVNPDGPSYQITPLIRVLQQTKNVDKSSYCWNCIITTQNKDENAPISAMADFLSQRPSLVWSKHNWGFVEIKHYGQYTSDCGSFGFSGTMDYSNINILNASGQPLPPSLMFTVDKPALFPIDYLNVTKVGVIIKVLKGELNLWIKSSRTSNPLLTHLKKSIKIQCFTMTSHGTYLPNIKNINEDNYPELVSKHFQVSMGDVLCIAPTELFWGILCGMFVY